jgi:hypothetical protein
VHDSGLGMSNPGAGVWERIVPWSKCFKCNVCSETPVVVRPARRVWWRGAAPRKLDNRSQLYCQRG